MNTFQTPVRRSPMLPARQVEGEGVLRMILLALALAMPLASMAYLKIQETRLSYEMSDLRSRIKQEEELNRKLLLERSRYQRDEAIQSYATESGMQPRRQSHLIHRSFTADDQRLAKLRPVSSFEN
ncbi:MAG: hypothetical protein IPN59_09675 [Holophaga sp.]|nr:hypothetical protein [Holophaga sp.]